MLARLAGWLIAALAPTLAAAQTDYPGGFWEPPAPSFGVVIVGDVLVPMDDGVVLVGDVYYPADLSTGERAPGAFPVMLSQSPYNTTREAGSALGTAEYFVERGYIFVEIDVRGSGRSGGSGNFMGPQDQLDGVDMVDWAAHALDGSNGTVILFGCSYRGHSALNTAAILGPNSPVKAMIASCAGGDPYRHIHTLNGIPSASWRSAGLGAHLIFGPGFAEYMLANWVDSQIDDANGQAGDPAYYKSYWEHRDHIADAEGIVEVGIPVLIQSAWDDSGSGGLDIYASLQNAYHGRPAFGPLMHGEPVTDRYQLIVGNWGHGGGLDDGIMFQWLERWIYGVDTGIDTQTPIHLQVIEPGNTGRWINAAGYPMTSSYTEYFLDAGGILTPAPPAAAGTDTVIWAKPTVAGSTVTYTSAPFAAGALLGGPVSLVVHASSSNTNLLLVTNLSDVAPDGTQTAITRGAVLGSMLHTDPDPVFSWVDDAGLSIRPYLTLQEDVYLTPGEVLELKIPFLPRIYSLLPGHALRLAIQTQERDEDCGASATTLFSSMPHACEPRPGILARLGGGTYTIERGGVYPSSVQLPLMPYDAFPGVRAGQTPTSGRYVLPLDWGADVDGDGIADASDNCPHVPNPGQADDGGIATDVPDGIGNACQCGDVTSEGVVNGQDGFLITRFGLGYDDPLFVVPGNCDVTGNGTCNGQDGHMVARKSLGLTPSPLFGQRCPNADPTTPCDYCP